MLYDDIRRLVRAARRGCAAKDGRFHAAAVGAASIASGRSMQVVVGGSAGERNRPIGVSCGLKEYSGYAI